MRQEAKSASKIIFQAILCIFDLLPVSIFLFRILVPITSELMFLRDTSFHIHIKTGTSSYVRLILLLYTQIGNIKIFCTDWLKPVKQLNCYNRIVKFAERKVSDLREISIREISELTRNKVRSTQTVSPATYVNCSDIYVILLCHHFLNNGK